jgi:alkylation response protein AidB-like acyl-CoA dehydrogenase
MNTAAMWLGCSLGNICADETASSKIFTIFEGTSEIQRMLIGRSITGLDVR